MIAGRNVELNDSSGNDVVDKLAVELEAPVDNLGQRSARSFQHCMRTVGVASRSFTVTNKCIF